MLLKLDCTDCKFSCEIKSIQSFYEYPVKWCPVCGSFVGKEE